MARVGHTCRTNPASSEGASFSTTIALAADRLIATGCVVQKMSTMSLGISTDVVMDIPPTS